VHKFAPDISTSCLVSHVCPPRCFGFETVKFLSVSGSHRNHWMFHLKSFLSFSSLSCSSLSLHLLSSLVQSCCTLRIGFLHAPCIMFAFKHCFPRTSWKLVTWTAEAPYDDAYTYDTRAIDLRTALSQRQPIDLTSVSPGAKADIEMFYFERYVLVYSSNKYHRAFIEDVPARTLMHICTVNHSSRNREGRPRDRI
jgi:hypothetical protein